LKKIISLFQRNYDGDRLVRNELVPGSEWVAAGIGYATRKWDGTCCRVLDGKLYKRYDAKAGKAPPDGFEPAQDPDSVTGHWPVWLPVGNGPEDRWYRDIKRIVLAGDFSVKFNGTDHLCFSQNGTDWEIAPDGTYELCGPRLQGNPDGFTEHVLIMHGMTVLRDCPRDYDGLKQYLAEHDIEGVVWWRHSYGDCDKVKIKAKDFGIKRGNQARYLVQPTYDANGEPTNIEAAALDAIQWLELMQRFMDNGRLTMQQHAENRQRLGRATDKLKQMIGGNNSATNLGSTLDEHGHRRR